MTFAVTSTADAHAAHPGNGRCADSAGRCTLRAAVETASAEPAGTSVTIRVPAGRYRLTLGSLDLADNTVSVVPDAGAARSTVVRAGGAFRVIEVGAAATAALTRVTITGGKAGPSGYGGGVYSAGQLTVSRSRDQRQHRRGGRRDRQRGRHADREPRRDHRQPRARTTAGAASRTAACTTSPAWSR